MITRSVVTPLRSAAQLSLDEATPPPAAACGPWETEDMKRTISVVGSAMIAVEPHVTHTNCGVHVTGPIDVTYHLAHFVAPT